MLTAPLDLAIRSVHLFVQLVMRAAAARVENNQALKACP